MGRRKGQQEVRQDLYNLEIRHSVRQPVLYIERSLSYRIAFPILMTSKLMADVSSHHSINSLKIYCGPFSVNSPSYQ